MQRQVTRLDQSACKSWPKRRHADERLLSIRRRIAGVGEVTHFAKRDIPVSLEEAKEFADTLADPFCKSYAELGASKRSGIPVSISLRERRRPRRPNQMLVDQVFPPSRQ